MNVLVTGATGFLGKHVVRALVARGDQVQYLARNKSDALPLNAVFHAWQIAQPPMLSDLSSVDAVIHLAGEPVAQRWNAEVKRRIYDSRAKGTRHLVSALAEMDRRPSVLISASAIGYYGERGDEVLTEKSAPGRGFLAEVCTAWESEAVRAREFGIRVVPVRIGVVLGKGGGALPKMAAPFRMGIGGRLASGRQWMSWIHVEDLVRLMLFAADKENVTDVLNGTGPNPLSNTQFTQTLAKALHRPALFSVPRFALRLAMGEMADSLLQSQRVLPRAAHTQGFEFRWPALGEALADILIN